MRKVVKTISDILFTAGLVIAGLFLVARFTGKMPLKVYIVSSGSMEPAIKTGGIVFVTQKDTYQVGDIVTYKSGPKSTTTHRIVAAANNQFKLAGDANNSPDPGLVDADKVIGTVRLSLPYLGYIANFAKTPRGFILLVIVPATIIIYEELKSLINELKKQIKKRAGVPANSRAENQRGVESSTNLRIPNASSWILKPAIILPIFFALLIPLTLTISYFIDRETSSGNSFTAFSSPQPTAEAATPTIEPTVTPTLTPTLAPTEAPQGEVGPTP